MMPHGVDSSDFDRVTGPVVIRDPDGTPNTGDESADDLLVHFTMTSFDGFQAGGDTDITIVEIPYGGLQMWTASTDLLFCSGANPDGSQMAGVMPAVQAAPGHHWLTPADTRGSTARPACIAGRPVNVVGPLGQGPCGAARRGGRVPAPSGSHGRPGRRVRGQR